MKKITSVIVLMVCTFSFIFVGCSPTTYNFNFFINTNGSDNYNISDYKSFSIDLTDVAERFYSEEELKSEKIKKKFSLHFINKNFSRYIYVSN